MNVHDPQGDELL